MPKRIAFAFWFCAKVSVFQVMELAVLSHSPWSAAIARLLKVPSLAQAGMLRRRMKSDVADVDSASQRHTEGLDRAIEVLVIERVLVVPDAGSLGSLLCSP